LHRICHVLPATDNDHDFAACEQTEAKITGFAEHSEHGSNRLAELNARPSDVINFSTRT
jgi:hypothetical protein